MSSSECFQNEIISNLVESVSSSSVRESFTTNMSSITADVRKSENELKPLRRTSTSEKIDGIFDKLIDSKGNLDMRSVTTLIWHHRNDQEMVQSIAEKLIANSNEKTVFNGIEFYLPQLAHMIIHIDVDISSTALEQFSLVVCQVSLHVALQLNWILVAAMQDYQPELSNGVKNPKSNPKYFARCIKLLQNVERIVALGSPGDDSLLCLQRERLKLLADQAIHVIDSPARQFPKLQDRGPKGYLFHKRWVHRSGIHRRGWIKQWFCLVDRVLYCHSKKPKMENGNITTAHLKRAIVLQDATIKQQPDTYKNGKYVSYFTVESQMGCWRLRAESSEESQKWVDALSEAAGAPPVVLSMKQAEELEASSYVQENFSSYVSVDDSCADGSSNADIAGALELDRKSQCSKMHEDISSSMGERKFAQFLDLDENQRKRYDFFNAEREFVRSLTDICEELRFVDNREDRGRILEERIQSLGIPDVVYLPLVKSTDVFRKILKITPNESIAFSTKARCPTLITFETCAQWIDEKCVDIEEPLDVANFVHWKYMSSGKSDRGCTTNALDGFQLKHQEYLSTDDQSEISEGRPHLLSLDRKSSFFNSIPKPHIHMPAVNIARPSIMNLGIHSTDTSITEQLSRNVDSIVGLDSAAYESQKRSMRIKPPRPNVWRQPVTKPPTGLFSPFSGKQFKVPSIQVPKIRMKWGTENPAQQTPTARSNNEQLDLVEESHSVSNIEDELFQDDAPDDMNGKTERSLSAVYKLEEFNQSFCISFSDGVSRAYHFLSSGESLKDKVNRLKNTSEHGNVKGWRIERIICKSNDDLRQEVFIMQLISFYLEVFQKENLDLWLQPYRILSTGKSTGLIQVLNNSISLHGMKKKPDYPGSLAAVFKNIYSSDSENLLKAQRRFAQSLAGYSVVSYLLAFKDRHNGNIMITTDGRIIHIDFGFVFGQAPGNKFSMERAPFKLTSEYVDAMGGRDSEIFNYFVKMVGEGLIAAIKYSSVAITLVEIMMFQSEFPCFANGTGGRALRHFKRRLKRSSTDAAVHKRARRLVESSLDHPGTLLYDKFQYFSNGILH